MRRPSYREQERAFVAEGLKVVSVALASGAPVESVFLSSEAAGRAEVEEIAEQALERGARVFEIASMVMERVADTVTPQPVCAIVGSLDVDLHTLVSGTAGHRDELVVVCVDVRDPGNLGALMRSAAASGARAVVCTAGTVDPFNPKAVRASAGALFQLPVVRAEEPGASMAVLREGGYRLVGTVAQGGLDYDKRGWGGRVALVLGNEASGLPPEVLAGLDDVVTVPMAPGTESLNVAMTATVICFEVARRRRSPAGDESAKAPDPGSSRSDAPVPRSIGTRHGN